jgi:hypothetical protein
MGTRRRLVEALPTSKPRRDDPRRGFFLCSLVNLSLELPGNRSSDRPESTVFIPFRAVSTSAARRRLPVPMSPGPTFRAVSTSAARRRLPVPMSPGPTSGVPRTDIRRPPDRHPASPGPTSGVAPGPPDIGSFRHHPMTWAPAHGARAPGRSAGARAYKVLIAYK